MTPDELKPMDRVEISPGAPITLLGPLGTIVEVIDQQVIVYVDQLGQNATVLASDILRKLEG